LAESLQRKAFQVLIVGGGSAGLIVAAQLLRLGPAWICLLEPAAVPRVPVRLIPAGAVCWRSKQTQPFQRASVIPAGLSGFKGQRRKF